MERSRSGGNWLAKANLSPLRLQVILQGTQTQQNIEAIIRDCIESRFLPTR